MNADLNSIILGVTALITAITPIMLAVITRRRDREVRQVRADQQSQADHTNRQLYEIHTEVNNERALMIEKLEAMNREVLRLTKALSEKA